MTRGGAPMTEDEGGTSAVSSAMALLATVVGRPGPTDAPDADGVMAFARSQGVVGLCAQALCRCGVSRASDLGLERVMWAVVQASCQQQALFGEVTASLEKEGVPYLPIKGQVLRDLYPDPDLRQMGDIDILVHPRDRSIVRRVMEGVGFAPKEHAPSDGEGVVEDAPVDTYAAPGLVVEVHTRLFTILYDRRPACRPFLGEGLWEHAAPPTGGSRWALRPEAEFVTMVLHIASHLYHKGIGVRFFLDVALFARAHAASIDAARLRGLLRSLDLERFARVVLALADEWFGVPRGFGGLDTSTDGIDPTGLEHLRTVVLTRGTFGQEGESLVLGRAKMGAAHGARRTSGRGTPGGLRLLLGSLVPSRELMRGEISYFDRVPALLPVAWVHYTILALRRHGMRSLASEARDMFENVLRAEKDLEMLARVGL